MENSERDGNTRPPDLPLEKSAQEIKHIKLIGLLSFSQYALLNNTDVSAVTGNSY